MTALPNPGRTPDPLDALSGVKFAFGLRAQGHIPTIERMLTDGASWSAIGDAIGWCGDTAREWYERDQEANDA
jgi:hypothetical protein